MLNFTVGPVQMDSETLAIAGRQIPYFRTAEFSALMKENESIILRLADAEAGARCVFLTGSGTSAMEAAVMNFLNRDDKALVVNGGSFGARFVQLCAGLDVPFTEIKLDYGKVLSEDMLSQYENKGYTAMLLQLCETSTGILYDMNMVGEFCRRNRIFLIADAISGFLADDVSMTRHNINVLLTGSQKALSLPPGLSFLMVDEAAIARATQNDVHSVYFNLVRYLADGKRGQTPFTPAVLTLIMLNDKLHRIMQSGGYKGQQHIISSRAAYFRDAIKGLPLIMFTPLEHSSNCVTALVIDGGNDNKHLSPLLTAYRLFEVLKDEYGIWVCPNGGELRDKVFRVGHIGAIKTEQIDTLVEALKVILGQSVDRIGGGVNRPHRITAISKATHRAVSYKEAA